MDAKGVRQVPVEGSWKMDSNRDGEFIFLKHNLEQETWLTLDKHKKTDLLAFAKTYPLSINAAEALVLVQNIEATEAETKRIAAEREAEAKRKAEAQRKLELEKQAFERAKHNATVYNLNQFLKTYPLSIYVENIEKLLEKAEEEADWKDAKNKNNLTAYRGFMRAYPDSDLAKDAYKRIEAIEAELEAEELKRKNAQNREAERLENERLAQLKRANEKAEKERQETENVQKRQADAQKQNETEVAQAKTDRDKAERLEIERLAQIKQAKEKAEKEKLEKAEVERLRQQRLEKEAADKKTKEKPRLFDYQEPEPSFFQKFKMPLVGGGALLVAVLIWLGVPNSQPNIDYSKPNISTPSVSPDETAFAQAKQANTIPALQNFIENNPNSKQLNEANNTLNTLKEELAILLTNIKAFQSDEATIQNAKAALENARRIDPTNVEVIKFAKQLK